MLLSVCILPLNVLAPSATSSSGPLVAGLPSCPASFRCQPRLPVPDGIACSLCLSPFWLQRALFTNGHSRCRAWGVNGQFYLLSWSCSVVLLGEEGVHVSYLSAFLFKTCFQISEVAAETWMSLFLRSTGLEFQSKARHREDGHVKLCCVPSEVWPFTRGRLWLCPIAHTASQSTAWSGLSAVGPVSLWRQNQRLGGFCQLLPELPSPNHPHSFFFFKKDGLSTTDFLKVPCLIVKLEPSLPLTSVGPVED